MSNQILRDASQGLSQIVAEAGRKLFHVHSELGGRTGLSLDGEFVLVHAWEASKGEAVEVLRADGQKLSATVHGFDGNQHLALLKLSQVDTSLAFTNTSDHKNAKLGSLAVQVAFPSIQGLEAALGMLRIVIKNTNEDYLQTDIAGFPGFSGSALLDIEGQLLGFAMSEKSGNRSWYLPVDKLKQVISNLKEGKVQGNAFLGINTIPVRVENSSVFGDERRSTLLITALSSDGPAMKAGLLVGDQLISIGGRAVSQGHDLYRALRESTIGQALKVRILRGDVARDFDVIPIERPEEENPWWKHG